MNKYKYIIEAPRVKIIELLQKIYNGFNIEVWKQSFNSTMSEEFLKIYLGNLSKQDLENYCKDLYNDISVNGIKEPVQLYYYDDTKFEYHGYFRLAIADLLGIEKLKIEISTDNENLIQIANILFNIYEGDLKFALYQPIENPFFALCPVQNKDIDNKVNAIKNNLDNDLLSLDFGSNNGYLSRQLTKDNYKVMAIDTDKKMYELQDLFSAIGLKQIDFINGTIEGFIVLTPELECNVVALGLFHHYFETPELFNILENVITKWIAINVDTLIVEHRFQQKYYKQLNEEDYKKYWIDKCEFKSCNTIYETDNSTIFKFRKVER